MKFNEVAEGLKGYVREATKAVSMCVEHTPIQRIILYKFQRSRYDIWRGFGSDGYLYDFVKKRSGGHTQDYKNSLLLLGQSFIGGRGPDIIYGEGLGLMAFCMTLSSRLVW